MRPRPSPRSMVATAFYEEIAQDVAAIPVIVGDKTATERFAGRGEDRHPGGDDARRARTAGGDVALPRHELRDRLRHRLHERDGVIEHCHTTSWGMSTRMIGGVIMAHGDDRGLILPPRSRRSRSSSSRSAGWRARRRCSCRRARSPRELRSKSVRVHVDDRDPCLARFQVQRLGAPRRTASRSSSGRATLPRGTVVVADRLTGKKEDLATADVDRLRVRAPRGVPIRPLSARPHFRAEHTATRRHLGRARRRRRDRVRLRVPLRRRRPARQRSRTRPAATARLHPLDEPRGVRARASAVREPSGLRQARSSSPAPTDVPASAAPRRATLGDLDGVERGTLSEVVAARRRARARSRRWRRGGSDRRARVLARRQSGVGTSTSSTPGERAKSPRASLGAERCGELERRTKASDP